uniref:Major facilitator superfamily (MFS) profile domain-containing protein n=3 Tax=Photinus pyralis TaxID=7054 RepID=A0A1Y1LXB9_PHOPY
MTLTGFLSATWMGWPSAFYIFGAVGLIWTLTWVVLGRNSPAAHGGMDYREKLYIEKSLGQVVRTEAAATPWKAILTSAPVWALTAAYFAHGWGFSTLNTNVPSYMAKVLNFNIAGSGILSAAPYLLFWLVSIIVSAITDFVITRKYVTVGTARKVANSIGLYVPAVALIVLGLISDSKSDITIVTLVLLFIAIAINGSAYSGYRVNHMDLSLAHAGVLMGITNTIASISSIIAPLLLHFIVTNENDPLQWATIFYIAAPIYIVGNTIFLIFGSGETQPWNGP